jgi:hypothetical protein
MEIDFNPNRMSKPEVGQPIVRQAAPPAVSDSASLESFSTTASLSSRINDIQLVRPEKVDQAKALVAATSYPPVELLDRIAALFSIKL